MANLRDTKAMAEAGSKPEKVNDDHKQLQQMNKAEQEALVKEVNQVMDTLLTLSEKSESPSKEAFKEALKSGWKENIAEKAKESADKLATDFDQSAKAQEAVLNAMNDGLQARKSNVDQARELAERLKTLSDQQEQVADASAKASESDQSAIKNAQETISDKIAMAEDAISKLNPEASAKANEAGQEAEAIAKSLQDKSAFKSADQIAKTADAQNSVAEKLEAAGEKLQQQADALAAGFVDHFMDRQTIPGLPLYLNYQSSGGFGTPYREAFEKFAPLSDLVMQTFISNGDSESPEFSLKFYDDARVKSPAIRPWIYGQWEDLGINKLNPASPLWEERNRALMRIYIAHSLNFNALTKDKKSEVIPGGLALINLKKAFDAKKVLGLTDFFATNYADDLHLTENGRQFIGMVIFATLYDKSPVGLPVVKINDNGPTLTPAQNKVYQQVAWDTVQGFRKDRGAGMGFPVPGEIDARVFIGSNIPLRGSRVGNIDANRSFLYVLNADKAGKYDFKVSATTEKEEMKLDVFVNHQAAGSVSINPHKDQPAADSSAIPIDLAAGVNLLRVLVPFNRSYDLNSIKITRAGQPLKNSMPILDLSAWEDDLKGGEGLTRNFRAFDLETPAADLVVSLSSDNSALVPDSALKSESGEFKGQYNELYNRRLTLTPTAGQTGVANITVTAFDADGTKRAQSFKVKVK